HEIDYQAPALLGDRITVRTWVEAWSGVTSDRHVEFHNAETGQLLAQARTVWCAIDPATGRPKRFHQALVSAFQAESGGDAGTIASES
ncbi:MAG: thioesterase family protein, partial [Gemmatimonadota bacterium]